MSRYQSWRAIAFRNPNRKDARVFPIGGRDVTFHRVFAPVFGFFFLCNGLSCAVLAQGRRKYFPPGKSEPSLFKIYCLRATIFVVKIEQILRDFLLFDFEKLGLGKATHFSMASTSAGSTVTTAGRFLVPMNSTS